MGLRVISNHELFNHSPLGLCMSFLTWQIESKHIQHFTISWKSVNYDTTTKIYNCFDKRCYYLLLGVSVQQTFTADSRKIYTQKKNQTNYH